MNENDFLDGVSNVDDDVVERFVTMDNKLQPARLPTADTTKGTCTIPTSSPI